jgi:hypothetical protein
LLFNIIVGGHLAFLFRLKQILALLADGPNIAPSLLFFPGVLMKRMILMQAED